MEMDMENNKEPNKDAATDDWRKQFQPDSRKTMVAMITQTLKRTFPKFGPEELVQHVAVTLEKNVFTTATTQSDYLRIISLKMLKMETIANSLFFNTGFGGSNQNLLARHPMLLSSGLQPRQPALLHQQMLYNQSTLSQQQQQQMLAMQQQGGKRQRQQYAMQSTGLQASQSAINSQLPDQRFNMHSANMYPSNMYSLLQKQQHQQKLPMQQQGGKLLQQQCPQVSANMIQSQQNNIVNIIPHQQQPGQKSNMYSGLQNQQQQPMHTTHQQGGMVQKQQNAQVSANSLQIQGQAKSQPAQQQLMSQHISRTTQKFRQLGLEQQPDLLLEQQPDSSQTDMQQGIMTSGASMLNQQSLFDQNQVLHSQKPPPDASPRSIDAAITGNATSTRNEVDVLEEVYQTIKTMGENYLTDLRDMHHKISQKCQHHDALPQLPLPESEQITRLKIFKAMLNQMMGFLNLPESGVLPPSLKDKLASYEKHIFNILNSNR